MTLRYTGLIVARKSLQICILATIAAALVACGGKEERLASHLKKGRELVERGEFEKARVELKNVLQIEPKTAEAYFLSGRIDEEQANFQRAFAAYSKALDADPDHVPSLARIGRIYVMGNDLAKAEEVIARIIKNKPDDVASLSLKAAMQSRRGDQGGAIDLAKQVIARAPGNIDAISLLAGVFAQRGESSSAQRFLEEGISANPKAPELRLALIDLLVRQKDVSKAHAQFDALIAQQPDKFELYVGLAQMLAANGDVQGAEQTLRSAVKVSPKDDKRVVVLADFLLRQKKADGAEAELKSAIAAQPDAYGARFALASLYRVQGTSEKAELVLDEIIKAAKTSPEGLRARSELAELRIAQSRTDDALRLVAEVLKSNPHDNQALLIRGQMALDKGDAAGAISDLRAVQRDQPDSMPIAARLARAHLANNEPQLAVESIARIAAARPSDPSLKLAVAEVKWATKDISGALADIDGILKSDPKHFPALALKSKIEASQQQWKAASSTLETLREAFPNNPQTDYQLGMVNQAEGELDEAMLHYRNALQKRPGAIEPLAAIVGLEVSRGKSDRALDVVNAAIKENPRNFLIHALKGRLLAQQGKLDAAEASLRDAVSNGREIPGMYVELADFQARKGDWRAAVHALQEGLTVLPKDVGLRLRLADVMRIKGDLPKAIQEYEEVLKQRPADEVAANNLANLLIDSQGDTKSLERALELAKRFEASNSGSYLDTLGWAHVKLGQVDVGLPFLRKAVERTPDDPAVQYHLGAALIKQGDRAAAKSYLKRAAEAKVDFPGKADAIKLLGSV